MDGDMLDVAGDDRPSATTRALRSDDPGSPESAEAADSADSAASADEVAERAVEHDIDALLAEREQFKDIAVRLQADFENYRRRTQSQTVDEIDRATGKLVEHLLPVLDACEAAYAHGVDGIEPIWSALIGALQKQGLEAMNADGQAFDPTEHDAVVHEPGDTDEPTVAEVLRTGYRWKGKVLRAAMVKVKG